MSPPTCMPCQVSGPAQVEMGTHSPKCTTTCLFDFGPQNVGRSMRIKTSTRLSSADRKNYVCCLMWRVLHYKWVLGNVKDSIFVQHIPLAELSPPTGAQICQGFHGTCILGKGVQECDGGVASISIAVAPPMCMARCGYSDRCWGQPVKSLSFLWLLSWVNGELWNLIWHKENPVDRGDCLASQNPRFPSGMGDTVPRVKEYTEPFSLATPSCHTVGDCLSDKAIQQVRQSKYKEIVSFPCELEMYYFTAWSSLDQRWIKIQAYPNCLVC